MRLLKNKWFWVVAFGSLFALSMDFWAWSWVEPSVLGLPYVVGYIILLEGGLFALFFLFVRYYWTSEGEQ
jgi:hypothetical protein